ncbi:gluconolactonase [Paenibacillus montaniterrae]|uniref:Gluconolactonase n=1 Tax=Paenibacillus montaniterrae TaxID=429341 RepID=A0A919YN13_9BACL|nr:SMP-30/gluconolactonase/LRE family protein [Paenibacillus montaniterrae]GIP17477.1 gluconolactonase [Paenibacillus montaniterrae]
MVMTSRHFTQPGGFTSGIEGPACDPDGFIYAVNYERQGTIGKISPQGDAEVWIELPEGSIGSGIRCDINGNLLVADYARHHIFHIDRRTKEISVWAHEPAMNQPNDLAIMKNGTLLASDPDWDHGTGNIWIIAPDRTVTLLDGECGTTNGIEISPDERILYVNESLQRRIWAYDLLADGGIANKRLLIQYDDHLLDGMRCDMEGNLYVTRYGKGTVAKLSPDGKELGEIMLKGNNGTNLTFGGADGRICYVTVADTGNIQRFDVDCPGRCWGMWC